MNIKNYLDELKRRHVIKAGLAYIIVAWLIIEVANIILPTFNAPAYLMKFLIFVLSIGFFINLIFAWIYDITPDGIQKTQNLNRGEPISKLKSSKLNKLITGSLIIVIIILLFNQFDNSHDSNSILIKNSNSNNSRKHLNFSLV